MKKSSKKLSNIEKFNLFLGTIGISIAIVSLIFSYKSLQQNEEIAERSGAFDKGDLCLLLNGALISPNYEYDIYYSSNKPISGVSLIELPIALYNRGEKTVENSFLSIVYPHFGNIALKDSIIFYGKFLDEDLNRSFSTLEPFDQVSFSIKHINPSIQAPLKEFLIGFPYTENEFSFPVQTKDSTPIDITTKYRFSLPVSISITGKDVPSKNYNLSLNYYKQAEKGAITHKILKEKLHSKEPTKNLYNDFFILFLKQTDSLSTSEGLIHINEVDYLNSLICRFDKEKEVVFVTNQNGYKNLIYLSDIDPK